MSRWFLVVVMFMGASFVSNGCAEPAKMSAVGAVDYFGFELERITGIPEAQIHELGCSYTIERQAFLVMLKNAQGKQSSYDSRDVRARVDFGGGDVYFVNREGVVRHDEKYFVIPQSAFTAALIPVRKGKCK